MLQAVLNMISIRSLNFHNNLENTVKYCHFTDEEIEAWRFHSRSQQASDKFELWTV